ncbi:glycosyl transferase family 28 [Leptospira weilii]|uniref:glycosyl transferase family 28 n=1 Tax=Leptospira weilii TaxID=28184 RepID=UPI000774D874|nr:glycosyl transferase family 28 [Leptospira weilii]
MVIAFRVDGGNRPDVAMGHIYRSCLIADRLKAKYKIIFISQDQEDFRPGHQEIRKRGYDLYLTQDNRVDFLLNKINPAFAVIDLYEYSKSILEPFVSKKVPILTFDHFDDSKLLSHFTINPVLIGGRGEYDGLKYTVIPNPLRFAKKKNVEEIFLSFGGYDYGKISKRVLQILSKVAGEFKINLVIGSSFPKDNILELIEKDSRVRLFENPKNFNEILARSDIAVVAGGLTFFQSLSEGIPCIVICQYEHQKETAQAIGNSEMFRLLGVFDEIEDRDIQSSLEELINDSRKREQYSKAGIRSIDGLGLNRIINIIESVVGK